MFDSHRPPDPDNILGVMKLFADDPRPEKVDLGVGVYRNPEGETPIFRAVKEVERRLVESQTSKGYVALAGDPAFHDALGGLALGGSVAPDRIAALATPGGTGAVRQAFELVRMLRPEATVHCPAPTWPNHESILDTLNMRWRSYRYYDATSGGIDRDGMLNDLGRAGRDDVVLLHGCCHNPTGADLALQDWQEVAEVVARRGAVPMVDLAYQGFGDGLEADVAGLRRLAGVVPELLLAISASKNFGIYRERTGLLLAVTETGAAVGAVRDRLAWLNRQNYAFPPDHGARVVTEILGDARLRADWEAELDSMRLRVQSMRVALADALREATGSDRFGYLAANRGMFSRLPATLDQVVALRRDHALYLVGDGRINLAGLTPGSIAPAARAIAAVLA